MDVRSTGRRSSNSMAAGEPTPVRTIFVGDSAEDLGGLLRQLLSDFMIELRTYTVAVDALLGAIPKHTCYRVFTTGGGAYLPNRLVESEADVKSIDLDLPNPNKTADQQRLDLLHLYTSVGKVINQMLRERIPLPDSFASPLLIYYLRAGEFGVDQSDLTVEDLKRAILDFDFDYVGALNAITGTDSERRMKMCNFIRDCMYLPREGALKAMKSGFDIIAVSRHLSAFTWTQFERIFIGRDVITPTDITKAVEFAEGCPIEFRDIYMNAVQNMTAEDARNLVRFCTGAHYITADTVIHVAMKPVASGGRALPLATSFSCTAQLFIPFDQESSTPDLMLENLRNSFKWGEESEFNDAAILFQSAL